MSQRTQQGVDTLTVNNSARIVMLCDLVHIPVKASRLTKAVTLDRQSELMSIVSFVGLPFNLLGRSTVGRNVTHHVRTNPFERAARRAEGAHTRL